MRSSAWSGRRELIAHANWDIAQSKGMSSSVRGSGAEAGAGHARWAGDTRNAAGSSKSRCEVDSANRGGADPQALSEHGSPQLLLGRRGRDAQVLPGDPRRTQASRDPERSEDQLDLQSP